MTELTIDSFVAKQSDSWNSESSGRMSVWCRSTSPLKGIEGLVLTLDNKDKTTAYKACTKNTGDSTVGHIH